MHEASEAPESSRTTPLRSLRAALFDRHCAWLVALALGASVLFTIGDFGITWDEPVRYFAGVMHGMWFRDLSLSRIDYYWQPGLDQPPMGTILGGFARYLVFRKLGLMNDLTACRVQSAFFVFALTFALFSLLRPAFGRGVALLAAVATFCLPRVFFAANLYALDYPVTAACVAAAWAFWKGLENPRWMPAAGVLIGLALLTKVNAFFLYLTLYAWFVMRHRRNWGALFRRPATDAERAWRSGWLVLTLLPPLVFVLGWPWLWPHPISRLTDYFQRQFGHAAIATYYMGRLQPPWHYPFVMTLLTVPLVTLLPMLAGIARVPFGSAPRAEALPAAERAGAAGGAGVAHFVPVRWRPAVPPGVPFPVRAIGRGDRRNCRDDPEAQPAPGVRGSVRVPLPRHGLVLARAVPSAPGIVLQ